MIEAIRRDVSSCIEVSGPWKLKRWEIGLLWKIPFLLLSRPWRSTAADATSPDARLQNVKVDAWIAFGCSAESARVVATGKAQARPVLLFLASNADIAVPIDANEQTKNQYGEIYADRRFALTNASKVICQSQWQRSQLRDLHAIDGMVLKGVIDVRDWAPKTSQRRTGVLWIGRYDDFHKRVDYAVRIARLCPEVPFKLIINPSDVEIEKRIRRECPANVTIIDYVPFDRMHAEFGSSLAFLSTGHPDHEGFPNVLLQAAASRTPIVSLYDFDDFLARSGAGVACDDSPERAALQIRALATKDETDWPRVERYLREHHSCETIAKELWSTIETAVTNAQTASA